MRYGKREENIDDISGSFKKNSLRSYASAVNDLRLAIKEDCNIDFFESPKKILTERYSNAQSDMKDFFVNESYDTNLLTTIEEIEDRMDDMGALFENSMEAVNNFNLNEDASLNALNPIVGMTTFVYKDILINNVFESAIDTCVALSPIVPITHEHRYLISPDGTKRIDISKEPHKILDMMNQTVPFKKIQISLPENQSVDIITALEGTNRDSISNASYFSEIEVATSDSETPEYKTIPCKLSLIPQGYNSSDADRYLIQTVTLPYTGDDGMPVQDTLTITMKENKLTIMSSKNKIKSITYKCRLDTSRATMETCTTDWKQEHSTIEISDGVPLSVGVNPNEVKDIAALFNVDQLTKLMVTMKDVMGNYKDSSIYKDGLVESFERMDDDYEGKFEGEFDFADIVNYHVKDPSEWRHTTFMDIMDSYVSNALQHLRDPNVTITVLGRPDLIRKIEPTKYEYQSPKNIGTIPLEFNRTITSNHGRQYNFNSSMKIKYDTENRNKFRILLNPTTSERFIYRLYNYMLVVSNEIKTPSRLGLPSAYAYERFKFAEWQPVQGTIEAINPTGFPETKKAYKNL